MWQVAWALLPVMGSVGPWEQQSQLLQNCNLLMALGWWEPRQSTVGFEFK